MVDDETQILEGGTWDPEIPMRVMITKNGRAAHCRNDCPFLLRSYSIQTMSWCSHCDPSDTLEKAHLEAARWVMRTSIEPQSVLHQFPVTDIPAPQSTVVHQFPVARILTT